MFRLLEVLFFYGILSCLAVAVVWIAIARNGFEGLEFSDSPIARLFKPFARRSPTSSDNFPFLPPQTSNNGNALGGREALSYAFCAHSDIQNDVKAFEPSSVNQFTNQF